MARFGRTLIVLAAFVPAAALGALSVSGASPATLPIAAASADPELTAAEALIRHNKFADAKAKLSTYLSKHPGNPAAEALLGVADTDLDDAAGAIAAFDAAGPIPNRFRLVVAKAYVDAAVDALKVKNSAGAVALAGKSLELQVSVNALFVRGTAYANDQKYAAAIADLERAKALATAGHANAATLNAIDGSLATSYLFGGRMGDGLALAAAVRKRDPQNARIDDALAAYYNQQAVAALHAGNTNEAVAELERAAVAVPSRAVALYAQAASALSQASPVDWAAVKAEADKALALDPSDARANYIAGIALANGGDKTGAITYLRKAKLSAGTDATLNADIDAALRGLGAS